MATTSTVLVTGNTYPVKERLKALGGRWDAAAKGWRVPANKALEAQAMVNSAPRSTGGYRPTSTPRRQSRGTWTGCSCGSVEEYERASDCASCRHDR